MMAFAHDIESSFMTHDVASSSINCNYMTGTSRQDKLSKPAPLPNQSTRLQTSKDEQAHKCVASASSPSDTARSQLSSLASRVGARGVSSAVNALLESPMLDVSHLHHEAPCQQKVDKAAALYQRALMLQPHNVPALCNYAALMSQVACDLGAAKELYSRAAVLEPNDATVLCNLGNLKREQSEDLLGAETLYKRALSVDPAHVQTLLSYGHQIALHSEDYDKAERLLHTALQFEPQNTESQQGLEWIRNMRATFTTPTLPPVDGACAPALSRAREELARRKSLKAIPSANAHHLNAQAQAQAESMAQLLLEEDEQQAKTTRQQHSKSTKKKQAKKKK